uniref:Uncharacterized protein n=1 Tax=Oncorhynchus kisutch TaxID=8019 RepID=A0A8C7D619_ONCKI
MIMELCLAFRETNNRLFGICCSLYISLSLNPPPPPPPPVFSLFHKCKCKDQNCELNYRSAAIPLPATSSIPAAQTLGWRQEAPRGAMSGRSYSSTDPKADHRTYLWARCNERKQLVHDKPDPTRCVCNLLNTSTIYANNGVSLAEVDIYGFDYDYTMAFYYNALNNMIYNTARLPHRYPEGIRLYYYIPNITARGLHYDIQKIDAFHYIQLGTVGLNPVPDEVLRLCGTTHHVPLHQIMKQFMNIFSIPEMTLLAVANDFFISNDIEYDPEHLIKDVSGAIGMVHIKGYMYKWIMQDLEKYILRGDEPYAFLQCLISHGKEVFLMRMKTQGHMDKGMRFMVGKDWRDFFDRVIVQADKPHFFNDCEVSMKPFRQTFGCCVLYDFLRLTGWRGSSVLYFGDCLYVTICASTRSCLYEQFLQPHGLVFTLTCTVNCRTLYRQVCAFQNHCKEALTLVNKILLYFILFFHSLIKPWYILSFTWHSPSSRTMSPFFRLRTKNLFNMASISCVLNYDLSYTFYPLCIPLQHEVPLWMDQICSGCMKTPFLEEMAHIC